VGLHYEDEIDFGDYSTVDIMTAASVPKYKNSDAAVWKGLRVAGQRKYSTVDHLVNMSKYLREITKFELVLAMAEVAGSLSQTFNEMLNSAAKDVVTIKRNKLGTKAWGT